MFKISTIYIITIFLIVNEANAQSWRFPDCRDLEVTEINFINIDTMLVTVYNHCDTCDQHVYTGLIAYLNEDTVAIEDVLGSKPNPANNDEYTYTLLPQKPFQISNDLWFEMAYGLCDSLKFADNLVIHIPPYIILNEDRITVNQNLSCNELYIDGDFTNYEIHISDEFNNSVANFTEAESPLKINTTAFDDQLYYLTVQHQNLENVRLRTLVTSCNNEDDETASAPQFNLVADSLILLEYYYDFDGEWPVEELLLQLVENVEIGNNTYAGFSAPNLTFNGFDQNDDGILDYNFLPIRYENGYHYERRENREVVVLKDGINLGDSWSDEFIYESGDTSRYTFDVVAFYETYNEFGIDYENVYQIKETFHFSSASHAQISTHYYNEEYGIIRREIPYYISGTYGPIIFNRIITNIKSQEISLENAQSNQFISFTIGERNIKITEFKENAWPFHGKIIHTDSIEFNANMEYPVSRAIYAFVPDNQVMGNHIETFGLEFNQIFLKSDLNMDSDKLINNEQFTTEFIQIGAQNATLSNFAFHQTYVIGKGQPIQVTNVESVLDHDNMIFVTGTFNGNMPYDIGKISNGQFKVLIEN